MTEKLRRPGPYTPLSVTFATGRTGTAILERFGLEGLGVWASMLAAAKAEEGLIVFRHEDDWGAIGLAAAPPEWSLKSFLTFLGQRKQTRTTRQGRVMYVELTRWEDWTKTKDRHESAWRKSRLRAQSKRDTDRDKNGTPAGRSPARAREELELEVDKPPDPLLKGGRPSRKKQRYTGCRFARGSHGSTYVRDPLGTDKPPTDWPHPAPTTEEVKVALNGTNGRDLVTEDPERYVRTAGFTLDPDELEQILDLHVPDEDERIRLVDLAADLRREAVEA